MQTLSDFIRERLASLGLTQYTLAEMAGMNPSMISRFVSGKIKSPTKETLEKLAGPLQCSLEELQRFGDMVREPPTPKILVKESVWALCVVLERIAGKPIEEILQERIKQLLNEKEV